MLEEDWTKWSWTNREGRIREHKRPPKNKDTHIRKDCEDVSMRAKNTSFLCQRKVFAVYHFVESVPLADPRWVAADAEIKVPSGENTELKRSPFKAWSRSIYSHATLTARNFFLAYFYPSSLFTCIFSKTSPVFFLCWLWLTLVPV